MSKAQQHITAASAEWVPLSAIYHHVLGLSPSPEAAKIIIDEAWQKGRLRLRSDVREHRAGPHAQKAESFEQPLSRGMFASWDWERGRATKRDSANTLFEFINIAGRRDDVLAVWPAVATEPATALSASPRKSGHKRKMARKVIAELFPRGLPTGIKPVELNKMVADELESRGLEISSPDTILRAAGLKP